ncbi:MAG TPA: DEAD/DEAH box helicase [Miltoncostaeaceae bacterium]|nr:DEAD/DEAH box helicase [Miltoncostaeaceae bacterium]
MTPVTFADLGVTTPVLRALTRRGIQDPFPIQRLVLPPAMERADLLVRAPTGSGKTLAFGLPLVETLEAGGGLRALVLAPTRELATQIAGELAPLAESRGLRVAVCHGGADPRRQAQRAAAADVLIATPGRLIDLTSSRQVRLGDVELLVLDEADRMLDMGFLPQVRAILALLPAERSTMLFSATLDGDVGRLAAEFTQAPVRLTLDDVPGDDAPLAERLTHEFTPCGQDERVDVLRTAIGAEGGPVIVFCRTKRGADRLARRLDRDGVVAGAIHGDLRQNARDRALRHFATGALHVLVATDVASRGIDLEDVALVVNFDPPEDAATYTHRVGRTARAGRTGRALTLVTPDQADQVRLIARALGVAAADGTIAGYPAPPPQPVRVPGRRPRPRVGAPPARRAGARPAAGGTAGAPAPANRVPRGSRRRTAAPARRP